MKALQSLTDLFLSSVTDPTNVELWAEDGSLICTQGSEIDGFELFYTVHVALSEVDVSPEVLMMHLVNWLNKFDPLRGEKGLKEPTFASQLLDGGMIDLKLLIDIQEPYVLEVAQNGKWERDGTRFDCVSGLEAVVAEYELDTLQYVGGHEGDLPCP
ncbi:phage tail protein, partial [Vibrio scophthalmi]|uniref:phage tail protein n=1 Tax=Vibrio scophthalmi TaxID=45658 RepID=UPI000849C630